MNTNNIVSSQRKVDSDLFPVCEKKLTLEWAKSTYKHYSLFDDSILSRTYDDDNDLYSWINEAKELIKDIKFQGTQAGRDEIIRIAVNQYNIFLPKKINNYSDAPKRPLTIQEVVASITDHDWYFQDTEYKRNIIHHLAYGITRKHNNIWLIEAEKKWLNKYNVSYKLMPCKRVTLSRGFVYKLMNSTFSNTTIKMIKRAMWSNLGEYITVRDNDHIVKKINNGEKAELTYEHKIFKNGKGVLVSKINKDQNVRTLQVKDQVRNVKEWVTLCVERQVSLPQILCTVEKFYKETLKQSTHSKVFLQYNNVIPKHSFAMNDPIIPNKTMDNSLDSGKLILFYECTIQLKLT